jgi:hypothetical protein
LGKGGSVGIEMDEWVRRLSPEPDILPSVLGDRWLTGAGQAGTLAAAKRSGVLLKKHSEAVNNSGDVQNTNTIRTHASSSSTMSNKQTTTKTTPRNGKTTIDFFPFGWSCPICRQNPGIIHPNTQAYPLCQINKKLFIFSSFDTPPHYFDTTNANTTPYHTKMSVHAKLNSCFVPILYMYTNVRA